MPSTYPELGLLSIKLLRASLSLIQNSNPPKSIKKPLFQSTVFINHQTQPHHPTPIHIVSQIQLNPQQSLSPRKVSTTLITASTVAPIVYRASPIDPALRDPSESQSSTRADSNKENRSISKGETSPRNHHQVLAKDISRPASAASNHSVANQLPPLQNHEPNGANGHTNGSHSSQPISLNHTRQSLPALSTLASIASAPTSSVRTSFSNAAPNMNYATASPAASTAAQGTAPPVCQNCQTSTTPLWRRDEMGSVLCNACGLFLKLHGRPRPISLKTDVIKSRNRVKTTGQGQKKKSHLDANGHSISRSEAGTPPLGQSQRRTSAKIESGASDRSMSPVSRIDTPGLHHDPNIAPQHMFDGIGMNNHHFQPSPSFPAIHLSHPSPGSTTSLNEPRERHLQPPQTYDDLLNHNEHLKTRVSELEVINIMIRESEGRLRQDLSDSRKAENELARRVADLERQLRDRDDEPATKRLRLSDVVEG